MSSDWIGSRLVRTIVPLIVLAAAIGLAVFFVKTRPKPRKGQHEEMMAVVEWQVLEPTSTRVTIQAAGTVFPAEEVDLVPEVSGRVVWKNPLLMPGGRFEEGEELLRIDPRDYEYAVRQQEGAAQQAAVELETERARKTVAEEEWRLLEKDVESTPAGRSLALREPQLQAAEAGKSAADSALAKARLSLERTSIRAPFNCIVLDEYVDVGRVINSQTAAASLAGTDEFWVRLAVPVADLRWIMIPHTDGDAASTVRITQNAGEAASIAQTGKVLRLYGDIEPSGRMARLLVSIPDPYESGGLPLLSGAYVEAEIQGCELTDVFMLPMSALREGSNVWLMNDESRLEIRHVDVAWKSGASAAVTGGLNPGEKLVTSRISVAIPGMRLQTREEKRAADAARAKEEAKADRNKKKR